MDLLAGGGLGFGLGGFIRGWFGPVGVVASSIFHRQGWGDDVQEVEWDELLVVLAYKK